MKGERRDAVTPDDRWLPNQLKRAVGGLVTRLFRTRVIGLENVPGTGGAILAGNHVSYLDPVMIVATTSRPVHFMAKAQLFSTWWLGWFVRLMWAFPVKQKTADREAIQTASSLLHDGRLVGIFPEGTRVRDGSDQLGEGTGGVAFIAMRTNVPVVPVGIANTDRVMPAGAWFPRFVKTTVVYCDPICPDDIPGEGRKERVEAMTTEIMRRISAAREEARAEAASR